MRTLGIVLIIAGIILIAVRGFNVQTSKKVAEVGPVSINKTENHYFSWPVYTGAVMIIGGIVVLVVGKKSA